VQVIYVVLFKLIGITQIFEKEERPPMVKPIVITATRDQILAKIDGLTESFSGFSGGDDRFFDSFGDDGEPSIVDEVKEILTKIAGANESAMLSETETAELLHSRDIYHFQTEAVRQVRFFLTA
jgi:hypothetical protein